ncbi:MAG: type II toxin-antitoxin system RelE/ParE family toxin [Thermincola sp.]|jgi:addiction module RelE/StbE family toxin|nr:type II toxin-antitoxin system RelE/ParE family toxin [Thermincola sp.]MDT3704664.1 type II toxin-antitoxin system RelE/ParE family toxin [Thermincola sp.]
MEIKEYSLKFTSKAEADLDEIYAYIANSLFAPEAAENLMGKIESGIMRLKAFPYSCSFVLDEPLKKRGYRKLIVDNYLVFYLVNEQGRQVIIARILYGASDFQDIL